MEQLGISDVLALSKQGGADGLGGSNGLILLFLIILLGGFNKNGQNAQGGAMVPIETITAEMVGDIQKSLNDLAVNDAKGLTTLVEQFNAVNNHIGASGQATLNQLYTLSTQLAQCCCDTQRGIDGVNNNITKLGCDINSTINSAYNALTAQNTQSRYENQASFASAANQANVNTNAIIQAIQAGDGAIIAKLNADRTADLTTEVEVLRNKLSQEQQTAAIIAALGGKKPS